MYLIFYIFFFQVISSFGSVKDIISESRSQSPEAVLANKTISLPNSPSTKESQRYEIEKPPTSVPTSPVDVEHERNTSSVNNISPEDNEEDDDDDIILEHSLRSNIRLKPIQDILIDQDSKTNSSAFQNDIFIDKSQIESLNLPSGSPFKLSPFQQSEASVSFMNFSQSLIRPYSMAENHKMDVTSRGSADPDIFNCHFCSFVTNARINLINHLKTHTDLKVFNCQFCTYTTTVKTNLVNHIRSHTGEKPFKCPFCDVRAAQKGNIKSHIARRHTQYNFHDLV